MDFGKFTRLDCRFCHYIFLGASIHSVDTPLAVTASIGTISSLVAGLSVEAITGIFLVKLKHA